MRRLVVSRNQTPEELAGWRDYQVNWLVALQCITTGSNRVTFSTNAPACLEHRYYKFVVSMLYYRRCRAVSQNCTMQLGGVQLFYVHHTYIQQHTTLAKMQISFSLLRSSIKAISGARSSSGHPVHNSVAVNVVIQPRSSFIIQRYSNYVYYSTIFIFILIMYTYIHARSTPSYYLGGGGGGGDVQYVPGSTQSRYSLHVCFTTSHCPYISLLLDEFF